MDTSALAVVLNECNSHLITQANERIKIEKIVDDIIDELIEFIDDVNYYNDTKYEIDIWRKLLEIKHNDSLQKRIERYDRLHEQLADINSNIMNDYDNRDDTTPLIQATNAIYLLKYRKQIIDHLTKNINKRRTTKCCNKTLNANCKDHKHYNFYTMIKDRREDIKQNACKRCRHFWEYNVLYNCEICHLKWMLFYRCFFQYICRSADNMAIKPHYCNCFYNDYSSDEIRNAGMDDRTIERSFTYLKTAYDAELDLNENEVLFRYDDDISESEYDAIYETELKDII